MTDAGRGSLRLQPGRTAGEQSPAPAEPCRAGVAAAVEYGDRRRASQKAYGSGTAAAWTMVAVLGGERCEIAERGKPGERLPLELADALARQVELVPDRLERPRLALEAEAQLEDPPFPLR